MSKKRLRSDKEIENIINEWNENGDTTDCSDCETTVFSCQYEKHEKENMYMTTCITDSKTNALKSTNMLLKPINIALKPRSDTNLLIISETRSSQSEDLHSAHNAYPKLSDSSIILIPETNNFSVIDLSLPRRATGSENDIDNLPVPSEREGGGLQLPESFDSDFINLSQAQQATRPDKEWVEDSDATDCSGCETPALHSTQNYYPKLMDSSSILIPETTSFDVIDLSLAKKATGTEKKIDNLPITSGSEGGGIQVSESSNSNLINLPQAQPARRPDKDIGNLPNTSECEDGGIQVLKSSNSDLANVTQTQHATASDKPVTSSDLIIENIPVYAEDGFLIISSITQKPNATATESENTPDNLLYDSDGASVSIIMVNESANSDLISTADAQEVTVLEERSSNQIEAPQQISENITEVTKRGGIRKRKQKNTNEAEAKKKKLEKLADKHKILECCDSNTCKMKCSTKINEERRVEINEQYWMLKWLERRAFILNSCERFEVKRRTTTNDSTARNNTFKYFFKDSEGVVHGVCKTFFLTTLGYKKSNDRVLHDVLSKTPKGNLQPNSDQRGRQSSANKISDVEFREHVESFQPTISHYRREHAPNVRYLPSDITITIMYHDFVTKYPTVKMSYETYRQKLKKMNISFTRLGHEECSACEVLKLHEHDKDNIQESCETCITWKSHHEKYTTSRALYRKHAENMAKNSEATHFSADLEKVIMLPRAEGFKEVIFAKRLTVYNECFVPVGEKSATPAFAAVWHEGIAGRCKEELISTFYAFLLTQRDKDSVEIWLDNCSSQNKNWCFLSFLVFIINSDIINCETIVIHYFEPGHTFMSADSLHHQIELSLKKRGKVYDFNDFVDAVRSANKSHVIVKSMMHTDFQNWKDYTSAKKLKEKDRPFLGDIVNILAKRGEYILKYKKTYEDDEEYKTLNFLKVSAMKKGGMTFPITKQGPKGFSKEKKENILHVLKNILPENRKQFWRDLPEPVDNEDMNKTNNQRKRK